MDTLFNCRSVSEGLRWLRPARRMPRSLRYKARDSQQWKVGCELSVSEFFLALRNESRTWTEITDRRLDDASRRVSHDIACWFSRPCYSFHTIHDLFWSLLISWQAREASNPPASVWGMLPLRQPVPRFNFKHKWLDWIRSTVSTFNSDFPSKIFGLDLGCSEERNYFSSLAPMGPSPRAVCPKRQTTAAIEVWHSSIEINKPNTKLLELPMCWLCVRI